jgi:hypothetical protein
MKHCTFDVSLLASGITTVARRSLLAFFGCMVLFACAQTSAPIVQTAGTGQEANVANPTTTICRGQPLPPGYVIVLLTSVIGCGSPLQDNAEVIKQPDATDTVCSFSPIPPNYVVVGSGSVIGCGSPLQGNAKNIRRL